MNREIKFRAWYASRQKMINSEMLFINEESDHGTCSLDTTIKNLKSDYILMQFTGLHDKNGKEIYEGDVIAVDGEDKPMKITWGERQATFCIESEAWVFPHYFGEALESKDCVVIGNIYENPELLTP
jgi:uncharacterized phage protein (TIGR01671 family)